MADHTHQGHRDRMFERVEKYGWESLSSYELIEMMLFYSIPRVNTNGIAHAMLDQFGSVKGILDADPRELMKVPGVGSKSAQMIKMMPELLRRYLNEASSKSKRFDSIGMIGEYFYRLFLGTHEERLYMMTFNNRMNLLDCTHISTGVINCSEVMMRKISEKIVYSGAAVVAFAHNHPEGMAVPSATDVEATEILRTHVENMGVQMLEHLVFADKRFTPIMRKQVGTFRMSPISQKIDVQFYDRFYEGQRVNEQEWEYVVSVPFPGVENE